jgi:hypothetical protein
MVVSEGEAFPRRACGVVQCEPEVPEPGNDLLDHGCGGAAARDEAVALGQEKEHVEIREGSQFTPPVSAHGHHREGCDRTVSSYPGAYRRDMEQPDYGAVRKTRTATQIVLDRTAPFEAIA